MSTLSGAIVDVFKGVMNDLPFDVTANAFILSKTDGTTTVRIQDKHYVIPSSCARPIGTKVKILFPRNDPQQPMIAVEQKDIATQQQIIDLVYPVGAIYMSVNATNPTTFLGGTWVAWGAGRVPVGVDTTQTEFNTVQKTGGHKNLQQHTHSFTGGSTSSTSKTLTGYISNFGVQSSSTDLTTSGVFSKRDVSTQAVGYCVNSKTGTASYGDSFSMDVTHTHAVTGTIGSQGSGTAQNLQPYVTCYMWRRTA